MQSNLINKYNKKELFNLILNYLKKTFVGDIYSLEWEENKYISLKYIRYTVLRLELYENDLIVRDFCTGIRFSLLDIEDASNYLNDKLGGDAGKKFLIYTQCNLI